MNQEEKMFIKKYDEMCSRVANGNEYPELLSKFEAESVNGSYIQYFEFIYIYGACERGRCEPIFQHSDWRECMYYPICFALERIGFHHAASHSEDGVASRIVAFNHVINNLKILDTNWAEKYRAEAKAILAKDSIDF